MHEIYYMFVWSAPVEPPIWLSPKCKLTSLTVESHNINMTSSMGGNDPFHISSLCYCLNAILTSCVVC